MHEFINTSITLLAQADGRQPNPLVSLLPFFLLFAGMYFLIIAPQRKKQKQHEKMVSELERGDMIVTTGGVYGEITSVKPDRLILKIADNTRVELNRNFVHSKVTPTEKD